MIKLYISSKFSSRKRIMPHRKQIEDLGIKVLSHWMIDDPEVDPSAENDSLGNNFEHSESLALRDIEDVAEADILVLCTEDDSITGGREQEGGMGLMWNRLVEVVPGLKDKLLFRVGPIRNVFHTLYRGCRTWDELIAILEPYAKLDKEAEEFDNAIMGIAPYRLKEDEHDE